MCKKTNIQVFLLFAIEMAVSSVLLAKKGLGPLEVQTSFQIYYFLSKLYV